MAYTNKTIHYELPQYVGTDVPTILQDVNGAYEKLDTAIYQAKQNADTVGENLVTTDANVAKNAEDIAKVDNKADTNASNITSLGSRMTATENAVNDATTRITNINDKVDKAVADINSDIEDINSDIEDIKTELDGEGSATEGLTTRVSTLESDMSTAKSDISTNKGDIVNIEGEIVSINEKIPSDASESNRLLTQSALDNVAKYTAGTGIVLTDNIINSTGLKPIIVASYRANGTSTMVPYSTALNSLYDAIPNTTPARELLGTPLSYIHMPTSNGDSLYFVGDGSGFYYNLLNAPTTFTPNALYHHTQMRTGRIQFVQNNCQFQTVLYNIDGSQSDEDTMAVKVQSDIRDSANSTNHQGYTSIQTLQLYTLIPV